MTPLDILYIALALSALLIAIPTSMVLFRMYQTLGTVQEIATNVNRFSRFLVTLELIPSRIMNKFFR